MLFNRRILAKGLYKWKFSRISMNTGLTVMLDKCFQTIRKLHEISWDKQETWLTLEKGGRWQLLFYFLLTDNMRGPWTNFGQYFTRLWSNINPTRISLFFFNILLFFSFWNLTQFIHSLAPTRHFQFKPFPKSKKNFESRFVKKYYVLTILNFL